MSLCEIQKKYSMAQLALISHVASLRMKDSEKEDNSPKIGKSEASSPVKGRRLNQTNEQAYMLIAGGALG